MRRHLGSPCRRKPGSNGAARDEEAAKGRGIRASRQILENRGHQPCGEAPFCATSEPMGPNDYGLSSKALRGALAASIRAAASPRVLREDLGVREVFADALGRVTTAIRSEEHTSELQSLRQIVCRLLL